MGFGLGFCCCVRDCRIARPYLSARDTSVNRPDRILGECPWQNTLIFIELYPGQIGVPAGASIPNPGYAGLQGMVAKYTSQDANSWYYTRDDEADGIGLVIAVHKAAIGLTDQHGVDITMWDADHYANYVYDPLENNLVSVIDEQLDEGRRRICPRSPDGPGSPTFALVPFATLARWPSAGRPNAVSATISGLPDDSRDCDELLEGAYSTAVQPSVTFGTEIDRHVYSPATITNTCRGPNHGGLLGGVNWCRPHVPLIWLDSVSSSFGHINGSAINPDVRMLWVDAFYDRADPAYGFLNWLGRVAWGANWPGVDPDTPDAAIAAALPFLTSAGSNCTTLANQGAIDALTFSVV